jgi:hypothetical protein
VCVVDNITAKLGEVQHTGVIHMQLVVSGLDKPVAQTRLSWSLPTEAVVARGREATHCHPDGGHLGFTRHSGLQREGERDPKSALCGITI